MNKNLQPFMEQESVEDLIKLAVIGHETMHCFGYDHY